MAFKNEFGDAEKDLYLRGLDVNNNKELDWNQSLNNGIDKLWQLRVYSSTNIFVSQVDGRNSGLFDSGDAQCEAGIFDIEKPTFSNGGDWEQSIASIRFKLKSCTEKPGKMECDIGIDESVGLQWSNKLKPKAIFCASS